MIQIHSGDNMSEYILTHPEGMVRITDLADNRRGVRTELVDPDRYCQTPECETTYPIDLIEKVLATKGPAWVCELFNSNCASVRPVAEPTADLISSTKSLRSPQES